MEEKETKKTVGKIGRKVGRGVGEGMGRREMPSGTGIKIVSKKFAKVDELMRMVGIYIDERYGIIHLDRLMNDPKFDKSWPVNVVTMDGALIPVGKGNRWKVIIRTNERGEEEAYVSLCIGLPPKFRKPISNVLINGEPIIRGE